MIQWNKDCVSKVYSHLFNNKTAIKNEKRKESLNERKYLNAITPVSLSIFDVNHQSVKLPHCVSDRHIAVRHRDSSKFIHQIKIDNTNSCHCYRLEKKKYYIVRDNRGALGESLSLKRFVSSFCFFLFFPL